MVCRICQHSLEPDARFCSHCGHAAGSRPRGTALSSMGSLSAIVPAVALVGSFTPWLFVGLRGSVPWNVYHFGWFSALWLVADVSAIVWSLWWLVQKELPRPRWMLRAWKVLGAMSFGVAVSSVVFVKVAGAVSAILAAPNPVHLAYGSILFLVATGAWVVLIAWGYPNDEPRSSP